MAWVEITGLRTLDSRTWRDDADPLRYVRHHVLKTALHYGDGNENEVDFELRRVDDGRLDGWRVTQGGWHYFLGQPGDEVNDGWVGFGGREGTHWLLYRLLRCGYLHWPSRSWQDVGGAPTYDRLSLSRSCDSLAIGPAGAKVEINVGGVATWGGIWSTPGGGDVSVRWRAGGRCLKEEIVVNQAAREWIASNRQPETPIGETWFGFVFRLDVEDIPRWHRAGVLQDIDGDFADDGERIEMRDDLDRLLGVMPVSQVFSEPDEDGECELVDLRKRIWRDGDDHFLLVGVRVDRLVSMRAGPVAFDPTFEVQPDEAASKDTYINSAAADTNYGIVNVLRVADSRNTLIEFDLSSIDGGATVSSATLYLWSADSAATKDHYIYELRAGRADWVEGEATWNIYKTGSNWGTAGCANTTTDYIDSVIGTISFPNNSIDTEASCALTAVVVQDWIGAGNEDYGMVIKHDSGSIRAWHSSSAATAGYYPKLVVEYTLGIMPVLAADGIHSVVFGGQVVR